MPSRRSYLTTISGLAVGVAGCVSRGDDPASPNSDPAMPGASPTGTGGSPSTDTGAGFDISEVEVYDAAVQHSFRHVVQVDWNGVHAVSGEQFVFVGVDARAGSPAPSRFAFSLVCGDETFSPTGFDHDPYDPPVDGHPYTTNDEYDQWLRGWLAFVVPAPLDSRPTLRLEHEESEREWRLTDAERATAPPPAWAFDVDAPGSVAPDESFALENTASNVGDGPGVFRGAVNFTFPSYRPEAFDVELDPGESGIATVDATSEGAEPGRSIRYDLRTPLGARDVTVAVEAEGEETSTG